MRVVKILLLIVLVIFSTVVATNETDNSTESSEFIIITNQTLLNRAIFSGLVGQCAEGQLLDRRGRCRRLLG